MSVAVIEHVDEAAFAVALAARLEALVREAITARGRALLALAGGRTPLPAYRRLATATLDWEAVTIVPTDERWVAHRHPGSNLRALREAFAAADGVELAALTPADPPAEPYAATALRALARRPAPFDAVLLGMGSDGHVASLFPGAAELDEALADAAPDALVVHAIPPPAAAPYPRISLSAARLRRARALVLAISGMPKRRVLEAAWQSADARQLPVAAVLHAPATPLEVHWNP